MTLIVFRVAVLTLLSVYTVYWSRTDTPSKMRRPHTIVEIFDLISTRFPQTPRSLA